MDRLDNGERFPELTAPGAETDSFHLPDDVAGEWAILLFYRGDW